jgi:3-isopropylmalate dehydrogenase
MPKDEYDIAVIPGDGSGPELIEEGMKVLEAVQEVTPGLVLSFTQYEVNAALYKRTGIVMPPDVFEACRAADAIFKGPIGLPDVRYPDGTELNVDILLRVGLDLYANVRPVKLRPGVATVLHGKRVGDIDYAIVRENTEGLYASWAGDVAKSLASRHAQASGIILRDEVAVDTVLITRSGTERIVRYACELARQRNGAPGDGKRRVTCVDKSNVLKSYAFFRRVFDDVAAEYPDIERDYAYVDAMTQAMVKTPEWFDVVVAENLFGDIISDLGSATVGSIGLGPSANVGEHHGLFEPIHGSAPNLAGKRAATPIGQILAGKMMLDWLGQRYEDGRATMAAEKIETAVSAILAEGETLTADLGGTARTDEVGDAIARRIRAYPEQREGNELPPEGDLRP